MLRFENRSDKEDFWLGTFFVSALSIMCLVAIAVLRNGTPFALSLTVLALPAQILTGIIGYRARKYAKKLKALEQSKKAKANAPAPSFEDEYLVDIDTGTVAEKPTGRQKADFVKN